MRKPLLVPVVGIREEGAGASVGVELNDHPFRGPIGNGGRGAVLRGYHQLVDLPVPAHGEEPLRVGIGTEPAQTQFEEVCRDGAVGERHLLVHGLQPAHLAGDEQDPRRQMGVLGLDVETTRSEHVVVPDSLGAQESTWVVHQVAHRVGPGASGSRSPVSPRRPPWRGPGCTGEQGLPSGTRSFHRSPPIVRSGCRGASSSGSGCLR